MTIFLGINKPRQQGVRETKGLTTHPFAPMKACPTEFLSLRDIAEQYRGGGTVATWRCRISRNTGGIRSIVRKVGGSIRIQRSDLDNYLKPTGETP